MGAEGTGKEPCPRSPQRSKCTCAERRPWLMQPRLRKPGLPRIRKPTGTKSGSGRAPARKSAEGPARWTLLGTFSGAELVVLRRCPSSPSGCLLSSIGAGPAAILNWVRPGACYLPARPALPGRAVRGFLTVCFWWKVTQLPREVSSVWWRGLERIGALLPRRDGYRCCRHVPRLPFRTVFC